MTDLCCQNLSVFLPNQIITNLTDICTNKSVEFHKTSQRSLNGYAEQKSNIAATPLLRAQNKMSKLHPSLWSTTRFQAAYCYCPRKFCSSQVLAWPAERAQAAAQPGKARPGGRLIATRAAGSQNSK
jgi:hypothetical protein